MFSPLRSWALADAASKGTNKAVTAVHLSLDISKIPLDLTYSFAGAEHMLALVTLRHASASVKDFRRHICELRLSSPQFFDCRKC